MKINILTFHREANFGANLQAYALRHHLSSLGHETRFIDFIRTPTQDNPLVRLAREWIGRSLRSTKRKIIDRLRVIRTYHSRNGLFVNFHNRLVPSTSITYRSFKELAASPPEGDAYIVGSDQVWSQRIVTAKDLPAYFLNFGKSTTRKIAYAASSGGESFPPAQQREIVGFLSAFHRVGVRETSLGDHLTAIGFPGAKWTPDPTFLIDWPSHLDIPANRSRSDIGLFILNPPNYDKITHTHATSRAHPKVSDFSLLPLDPFDWIRKISSVQILVTDSYHAVLFAIFTQTPFRFLRWGANSKRDERILALLESLDLKNIAVEHFDLGDTDRISPVNWDLISKKVHDFRTTGSSFLRESLL